jgi:hypothetical protein
MLWRRVAVLLAFAGGIAVPVAHAPAACAATKHQATLVIDTGDGVTRRCVGFDEDSISGKDVLDRAGVGVEYSNKYSEAFVCRILGVGNDQAHCPNQNPGQNWVYWEAKSGSSTYSMPSLGPSSTTVRDGDVEGWVWANAVPPPYQQCDPPATAPSSPPPPPPPPPSGLTPAPGGATATTRDTVPTGPGPAIHNATTTSLADASSTSTASTDTPGTSTSTTATDSIALRRSDDKGGSPWALAVVGALVVGLGAASAVISRRRRVGS